jgi:hypothetical protein
VESRIVGRQGPTAWRTRYEYDVAGPHERHTVTVRLSRVAGGYRAAWELVERRLRATVQALGRRGEWLRAEHPAALAALAQTLRWIVDGRDG